MSVNDKLVTVASTCELLMAIEASCSSDGQLKAPLSADSQRLPEYRAQFNSTVNVPRRSQGGGEEQASEKSRVAGSRR